MPQAPSFSLDSKSIAALPLVNHFLSRLRFSSFLAEWTYPERMDKRLGSLVEG